MENYVGELNSRRLAWCKKNRSHFDIVASMLEAMRDNDAWLSGYSLMKHASINSAQLREYLESLIVIGLVEMEMKDDRVFYRASEKGLDFLRQYYALVGMLLSTRVKICASNGSFTIQHLEPKPLR